MSGDWGARHLRCRPYSLLPIRYSLSPPLAPGGGVAAALVRLLVAQGADAGDDLLDGRALGLPVGVERVAHGLEVREGGAATAADDPGAGIDGKPRGLATYPIVATGDDTRPWGSMEYLPTGHASAPTDDNWAKALVKLVLTLHPRFRVNGAFLMSTATLIRIREIQDTNKRFMFADHGNLSDSPESGYILGYPVHIDNNMDPIGENKFPIAFGDFKQGYVVVDRHGLRIVRDETTVKGSILLDAYKRVGGGLADSRAIKWLKVAAA